MWCYFKKCFSFVARKWTDFISGKRKWGGGVSGFDPICIHVLQNYYVGWHIGFSLCKKKLGNPVHNPLSLPTTISTGCCLRDYLNMMHMWAIKFTIHLHHSFPMTYCENILSHFCMWHTEHTMFDMIFYPTYKCIDQYVINTYISPNSNDLLFLRSLSVNKREKWQQLHENVNILGKNKFYLLFPRKCHHQWRAFKKQQINWV